MGLHALKVPEGMRLEHLVVAQVPGHDLLHRFKVTFDGPRGRLWLDPVANLNQVEELDMTGLGLVATGDGFTSN